MGLMETTTTIIKRAELQEVGAPTGEGRGGRGKGRAGGDENGADGVMQVSTYGYRIGTSGVRVYYRNTCRKPKLQKKPVVSKILRR